MKTVDI